MAGDCNLQMVWSWSTGSRGSCICFSLMIFGLHVKSFGHDWAKGWSRDDSTKKLCVLWFKTVQSSSKIEECSGNNNLVNLSTIILWQELARPKNKLRYQKVGGVCEVQTTQEKTSLLDKRTSSSRPDSASERIFQKFNNSLIYPVRNQRPVGSPSCVYISTIQLLTGD